ncbi:hypothetical protein BH09PLA1_BH09PLA1_03280 [soil metagenome]
MRSSRKAAVLMAATVAAANLLGLSGMQGAQAADRFWEGTFSTNWGTAQNWRFQQQPGVADRAVFIHDSSGFPVARTTIDLTFDNTIGSMLINDPINAGGYTLSTSGLGLLRVLGNVDVDSDPGTVNPVTFDSFDTIITGNLDTFKFVNLTAQNGSLITVQNTLTLQEDSQLFMNGSNLGANAFTITQRATANINNGGFITTADLTLKSITPGEAAAVLNINSGGVLELTGATFNHDILAGTLNLNSGGTISFTNASGGDLAVNGSSSRLNLNRDYNMLNNARLQVFNGGDVVGSSFFDVGNGGAGRLFVSDAGSTVTAASTSDWGRGAGASANVIIQSSAAASYGSLRAGTSGGAATVSLSGATLQTSSFFEMGGGATNRNVSLAISGTSNFTVAGTATFNNMAVVNLSNGSANFTGGATFNTGSTLNWSGGSVNIPSGQNWTVDGGMVNNTSGGKALGTGVTVRVLGGGKFDNNSFFDIASGAATGTLLVDGVGSRFTSNSSFCDWGKSTGNAATITLQNSGVGTFSGIAMSSSGGASTLTLASGGQVNAVGSFTAGGTGSSARVNISGGTLNSIGTAAFNNGAVVTLSSGGLVLNGNSTFNTGATLNKTGGTLAIAANRTLAFAGGVGSFTGSYAVPNAATVAVTNGGRLDLASFFDVANSNATGTLLVDGANSQITTAGFSASDWGFSPGNTATVTFSNSGAGTFSGLDLSNGGGTTHLNLNSNGRLNIAGLLTSGGPGATVNVNVAGGTLSAINNAEFGNGTTVNLSVGSLLFGGDATFSTGASMLRTGGRVELAAGRTLNVNGGVFSLGGQRLDLFTGSTVRVTNGGQYLSTNSFDAGTGSSLGNTLLVDGANSILTASGLSDWGDSAATLTFSNGGVGTFNDVRASFSGSTTINISSGGWLHANKIETVANSTPITVNGGTLSTIGAATFGGATLINYSAGSIGIGGILATEDTTQIVLTSGGNKVLRSGGLSMVGTSKIDLNDNDMIVGSISTSKSQVEGFVRTARNGGNWNGTPGITSTAAKNQAAHNTTLGVLSGAEYSSVGGNGTFSVQSSSPPDTLVNYT